MARGSNDKKKRVNVSPKKNSITKPVENPFDKFSNSRKKFEVVNRRVKGEDRNVGRARAKSIDERKSKLLKDYHANKKSNVFTDKRFGEADANLSLEDKMFARFQKDRIRKARNISSSFSLNDSKVDNLLTHKGKVLGESNLDDGDDFSDDSEAGAGKTGSLSKDIVSSLHFGGGFVKKDREHEPEIFQKDRLSALQEIVMKSKLAKIQKKELKEDQENERLKLDSAFDSLLSSSALDITDLERTKNGRFKKERSADNIASDRKSTYEDSYDQSLIELAFDAKTKPTDRTKSATEIALEEREKLEKLETARLRRMNGSVDYDGDDENLDDNDRGHGNDGEIRGGRSDRSAGKVPKAGKLSANSRSRVRTDDDLDEESDVVGKRTLSAAVKSSSASGDEIGSDDVESSDAGEEEGSDDDEDDDDDEEGDIDEEGGDDDDEDGDEDDDYEDDVLPDYDDPTPLPVAVSKSKSSNGSSTANRAHTAGKEVFRSGRSTKEGEGNKGEGEPDMPDSVNPNMPHNIECPSDLESFEQIVGEHVRSPADMRALVDRILIWNSIHLPGKQGADNKNKMHNFMDIMLKVFIGEADMLPSCDKTQELEKQLDFFCAAIFRLSQDIPDACPALWGRTIKLLQNQLQKRLNDYAQGLRGSCWPSLGKLLLLQVLGHVFSVSDWQNVVSTSAMLFICQCIGQCPVSSVKDLSSGLLSCSIALFYIQESRRFVPEIVSFVHSVLCLYVDSSNSNNSDVISRFMQPTFNSSSLAYLSDSVASASDADDDALRSSSIEWAYFDSIEQQDRSRAAIRIFTTVLLLTEELFQIYSTYTDAIPELFSPVLNTLRSIHTRSAVHGRVVRNMSDQIAQAQSTRAPLQWRKKTVKSLEMKAPRYQQDYSLKKDIDPDKDRVKLKQLTRQLKRESKAAVRELRRDSDFLDQERFREQQEFLAGLKEERVKNFAWMETEQATINQQVRKGKGLMKGGGSAVAKKARVKR